MRHRLILDVDTGTDDAGAILLAATHPDLELVAALATWGNTTARQAARNTLALLVECGKPDVEVHVGASGPGGPAPIVEDASHLMGSDGLGGLHLADRVLGPGVGVSLSPVPAAEALVDLAAQHPGQLTLVVTAPMSTLAAALQLDPDLPGRLAGLVVMGGAVRVGGNITAAAEANVGHDPEAAAQVVEVFGTPGALASKQSPRLIPLDVTLAAPLTGAELEALERSPLPGATVVHELWRQVWSAGRLELGEDGMWPAHDLLATWCVHQPDVCRWVNAPLAVDVGQSAAWGATIVDHRLDRYQKWAREWAPSPASLDDIAEARAIPANRWDVALGIDAIRYRAALRTWLAGEGA